MDQQLRTGRVIATGASCAPIPAWVDLTPYDAPASANPHFIANGLCVLLDDSQIDLCGEERAWFYRRAELVTAGVGAERAAAFNVMFDPAYERLEVHALRVTRAGQSMEYLDTAVFEVLRRERNMERLIFDGCLTLHVTLPDVRPGDVVELAHTRYGMRRSFGDRHASWSAFEWGVGIIDVRLRLRTPVTRKVSEYRLNNPPEATQTEQDGVIDRRWRTLNHREIRYEQLTPPWVLQGAALQLSEWRDWTEVANAFAALYEEDAPLPTELETEIARIEAAEQTLEGRAAAALRFSQSAIRYLAISIGEGGFTPRSLADICATRYGDCKDKAKLFTAMARRLGVDACPALVNTLDGYALDQWLPSGPVFDHCIVRVTIGDNVYWLDGTRGVQVSPLSSLGHCHFGWALPLKLGVTALERMPDPTAAHTIESRERITLGDSPQARVRYEWRITSRSARAEFVREQIAREGSVGMFRAYAQDIQRAWPKAAPLRQTIETDDIAQNLVTVMEVYEIEDAWTVFDEGDKPGRGKVAFSTMDLILKPTLAPLDPGARKHPIYLGQPGRVTRRVEIESVTPHASPGWDISIETPTLVYKNLLRKETPHLLVLEQELDIRAMTMPATDSEKYRAVAAHLEKGDLQIVEMVNKKGEFAVMTDKEAERSYGWIWWAIWIGLFVAHAIYRYVTHDGPSLSPN
jgi:Domain of Unknown Function with PDB structure (DUF3857)/Transglutaminase-like superfamily